MHKTRMSYKDYFRNKKVTVMGLGLLGRGIGVVRFLAEHGALLTVTDLKTEEQLADALEELRDISGITYVLGEHRLEDFQQCDLVIKAASVPLNSPYIEEAKKNNIPVKMDASLFLELAPKSLISIGVTGTRGKSTVTEALFYALTNIKNEHTRRGEGSLAGKRVLKGGNVRDTATLPLLTEVGEGDIIVLELDSWQLQGFHDARISPRIAVFTTFFEDHLTYYSSMEEYFNDKAAIFEYQTEKDFTVFGTQMSLLVKHYGHKLPLQYTVVGQEDIPEDWELSVIGEHNTYNMACAKAVLEHLDIEEALIQKNIEAFGGVPGRLEYLGEKSGIEVYNDNNATTPDATIAALKALSEQAPIVLICGGTDKKVHVEPLVEGLATYCKAVVLYPGTGTDRMREAVQSLSIRVEEGETLADCVDKAFSLCDRGDILLFSPAFSSFGKEYKNEYDRNDQFVDLIKKK